MFRQLNTNPTSFDSIINDYLTKELAIKPELLPLQDDTPLLALGILDSLALLQFLVFLERTFGVQVDEFDIIPENLNTVRSICAYIRSRQESPVPER